MGILKKAWGYQIERTCFVMERVNNEDFLRRVAKRAKFTQADTEILCEALLSEIKEVMYEGKKLAIPGFGVFSLMLHKGHPVRFSTEKKNLPNYVVFSFSPYPTLRREFRDAYQNGEIKLNE